MYYHPQPKPMTPGQLRFYWGRFNEWRRQMLVAKHEIDGQYPVIWTKAGRLHVVSYGHDVTTFKGKYADLEAATDFGYKVRRQAECAGRIGG